MKRLVLTVAVIATSLMALTGCDKIAQGPKLTLPLTGEWLITHYQDDGVVSTTDYMDHIFDFQLKNVITATVNEQTSSGYWAISAEGREQEFSIGFNTGDQMLLRLNNDWKVISVTENEVILIEDGDEVHFTRQQK